MADLDDFFAKKDRKKSKSSRKFTTTEEVAKKLEDSAKKTEKQKKERAPVEGDEANAQENEQDEWKEFEEEKKDYTGLKIGNLTINPNQENNTATTENSSDQQDCSESGQDMERKSGPWKRLDKQQPSEEEPVKVEKKVEPPPAPSTKGTYVPPSLRNQNAQMQQPKFRPNKAHAPDIHNEDFFPTLSKSTETKKNRNEGNFEVVQHSRTSNYRQVEQTKMSSAGPKLNLGNRYNTLSNDS